MSTFLNLISPLSGQVIGGKRPRVGFSDCVLIVKSRTLAIAPKELSKVVHVRINFLRDCPSPIVLTSASPSPPLLECLVKMAIEITVIVIIVIMMVMVIIMHT